MAADTDYNICFWAENELVNGQNTTLGASTQAAGHAVTELENPDKNKTWRSTTVATQQTVYGSVVSYVDAVDVDSIVLVNHNFDSVTTIKIQLYYTPPVGPEQLQYDQTFSALDMTGEMNARMNKLRPYQNRVIHLDAGYTTTRWVITIFGNGGGITYFELGYIFVTKKFQPVTNFENAMFVPTDFSTNKRTKGGQKKTNAVPKMRGLEISIPAVKDQNDIIEYVTLSYVYGKRYPIFVDCHPAPQLVPGTIWGATQFLQAFFNTLYQVFGTMNAVIKISRVTTNFSMLPGRINIEENL